MKSQAHSKRFIFITIITIIFSISLYLQYTHAPITINNIIPQDFNKTITLILLFIVSIIFEFLKIKIYNAVITVQVMISLSILSLFGKENAIFFVIIYYFLPLLVRLCKDKVSAKTIYNSFLKYAHHVILIIIVANLYSYILPIVNNKYIDLLLMAFLYKALNFLIVDFIWLNYLRINNYVENLGKVFLLELWIYLSSIPLSIILQPIVGNKSSYNPIMELLSIFYFITIITFMLKSYSIKTGLYNQLKYELQKNKSISVKLEKMLSALKNFEALDNYEKFSKFMAKQIAHIFEYNYVLVNIFDYENKKIKRIASYGISEEDFESLKRFSPKLSFYELFAKEENRISNSYLFSADQISNNQKEFIYYTPIHIVTDSKELNSWDKNQTLVIPIGSFKKPIGYISLDQPQNGKIPSIEILRMIELFVQNMSYHFNLMTTIDKLNLENLKDPITSLYGVRYLKKIDKKFNKLILIDIKDFKKINSKYGLEKSDMVLKMVGKIIKKYTRKQDIVIRYIGDWFLIFSDLQYREIRERLKTIAILANKLKIDGEDLKIVLQIGIIDILEDDIMGTIFKARNELKSFDKI